MNKVSSGNSCRRQYSKPRLRVVDLAIKEVLAVGCKTNTLGPDSGNPTCPSNNCTLNDSS